MRSPRACLHLPIALALLAGALRAGGTPENAILIVDPTNPESLYVANHYLDARGIPRGNVIYMAPTPASFAQWSATQAPAFLGMLENLRLADHVDYVVLPSGGPFYMASSGAITDQCAPVNRFAACAPYTLVHQRALLASGTDSALHNHYAGAGDTPRAFDSNQGWQNGLPLPTGQHYFIGTMLGYTGANGNTLAEVLAMIDRSAAVDGTHPVGTFYFEHTSDVARSGPRDPVYPAAVSSITSHGGAAQLQFADLPLGALDCLGIMTGLAQPDILNANLAILPGAFCDHLTSYAATYDSTSQTKMSQWIGKGASGTSGAVEEPCNYSGKFPNARLHVWYQQGQSLGEAWLRSLDFAPMQQLFNGDALCRPFATLPVVTLAGVPATSVSGVFAPVPSASTTLAGAAIASYELLVDGRSLSTCGTGGHFTVDTTSLADGWHELRALAYDNTTNKNVGRWIGSFQSDNFGRSAALAPNASSGDLATMFSLGASAAGGTLAQLRLLQGSRVVAAASSNGVLDVFGQNLGAGSVQVQLEAEFSDGKLARSAPLALDIAYAPGAPANAAPQAFSFTRHLRSDQAFVLELPASFDSASASVSWSVTAPPSQSAILGGGTSGFVVLQPNPGAGGSDTLQYRASNAGGISNTGTITLVYDAPPACPAQFNYCIGAPNSAGPGSVMSSAGSQSYGRNDLTLYSYGNPTNKLGIFLYSKSQAQVALGDGFRCVASPIFRVGVVQTDSFGDAVLPLDWSHSPFAAGAGALHAGETGYFQLWYRDPGFGPAGTNLSDGLGVPLCE
ncbi:MAG: TIGR03790 family protein [Planctomycetes bacterium]|nr:TIGR03790 family protein [Planctomycetota bacterium]